MCVCVCAVPFLPLVQNGEECFLLARFHHRTKPTKMSPAQVVKPLGRGKQFPSKQVHLVFSPIFCFFFERKDMKKHETRKRHVPVPFLRCDSNSKTRIKHVMPHLFVTLIVRGTWGVRAF